MIRENLLFFILLLLPLLSFARIQSELSVVTDGFSGPQMSIEKIMNQQIKELGEIDLIEFLDLRSWSGQRVNKIIITAKKESEMGANAYITSNNFSISPIKALNDSETSIEFTFNKEIVITEDLRGFELVLQGDIYISEIAIQLQEPTIE